MNYRSISDQQSTTTSQPTPTWAEIVHFIVEDIIRNLPHIQRLVCSGCNAGSAIRTDHVGVDGCCYASANDTLAASYCTMYAARLAPAFIAGTFIDHYRGIVQALLVDCHFSLPYWKVRGNRKLMSNCFMTKSREISKLTKMGVYSSRMLNFITIQRL